MQRHASAARSEAAECRELQQLRSVYFHWPSDIKDSFISARAAARCVRTWSVHPSTRLSIQLYLFLLPPSSALHPQLRPGRSDIIFFWLADLTTFFFFFLIFKFLSSWSPFHFISGRLLLHSAVAGESSCLCFHVRCVLSGESTATPRCGNDQTCGQTRGLVFHQHNEGHIHTVCSLWDGAVFYIDIRFLWYLGDMGISGVT